MQLRLKVTLDGDRDTHNKMRPLRGGQGTYEQLLVPLAFALTVPAVFIRSTSEILFGVPMILLTGHPYWWTAAMYGELGPATSIVWGSFVIGIYSIAHDVWIIALGLVTLACRQDMHDQPRYKPLARSEFFADGRSARARVPGTVARGRLAGEATIETGKVGTGFVPAVPVAIDMKLLKRGEDRYRIYCTPCHGQVGRGDGVIVRRGYRQPRSIESLPLPRVAMSRNAQQ